MNKIIECTFYRKTNPSFLKSIYIYNNIFKKFSDQILGFAKMVLCSEKFRSSGIQGRLAYLCVSTNQHGRQAPSVSKFLFAASPNDEEIVLPPLLTGFYVTSERSSCSINYCKLYHKRLAKLRKASPRHGISHSNNADLT